MDSFEEYLQTNRTVVERFVRFKLPTKADAEDVLQEVYLTAYQKFAQLKNKEAFKAWILRIAQNKCSDWFREKAALLEIPLDALSEKERTAGRHGRTEHDIVHETLERLGSKDKQILYLYFWKELPQSVIAQQLNIPLGTVKSRLHTAKQHFKEQYPYRTKVPKGDVMMKKLPAFMPEYTIEASTEAPFAVKWEELMGWFLVPKLGESLKWAMYDFPEKACTSRFEMKVTGRAKVHGIEGVEVRSREVSCSDPNDVTDYTFVAQLTDTHCRYLAAFREQDGVREYVTFLDGDEFMPNWGFGEDNCGNETNLVPKGDICRKDDAVTCADKEFLLDVVGRYTVTIGGKIYDTVCVMDLETYNDGTASEQFIDRNGRTVLWRRFNRDDWAIDRYKKRWSEQLPENERITVNGVTYVHWYDCITDYIL